ncbi:MAG: hypothetical protein AB7O65_11555, partial [Candidatus Korobacteraceae bacterium]
TATICSTLKRFLFTANLPLLQGSRLCRNSPSLCVRNWGADHNVQFLPQGADRIKEATDKHINRPIAILLDGAVVMAPTVRTSITDSAIISGNFTQGEAQRIADGISR